MCKSFFIPLEESSGFLVIIHSNVKNPVCIFYSCVGIIYCFLPNIYVYIHSKTILWCFHNFREPCLHADVDLLYYLHGMIIFKVSNITFSQWFFKKEILLIISFVECFLGNVCCQRHDPCLNFHMLNSVIVYILGIMLVILLCLGVGLIWGKQKLQCELDFGYIN